MSVVTSDLARPGRDYQYFIGGHGAERNAGVEAWLAGVKGVMPDGTIDLCHSAPFWTLSSWPLDYWLHWALEGPR